MTREFTVRDLVHGPFKTCPQCGAQEFGVYGVHGHVYRRRCRACWHGAEFPLSPLLHLVARVGCDRPGGGTGSRCATERGASNDVQVLCLQPYCDAMFVDNGCRALWEKVPKRYRPPYAKARLFSYNTRDEFLDYLDEVEAQGDEAVIHCARELHGEPQPYLAIYDDER